MLQARSVCAVGRLAALCTQSASALCCNRPCAQTARCPVRDLCVVAPLGCSLRTLQTSSCAQAVRCPVGDQRAS
eukprot:11392195-Alexandrium_andersonii.AAC.1